MFIEDILCKTIWAGAPIFKPNDEKYLSSFADQIYLGNSLTEKQAKLSVTLLKKYKNELTAFFQNDISNFLENPKFKLGTRSISHEKSLKIEKDQTYGKIIKATFPYNEEYVAEIRKNRSHLNYTSWSREEKSWIFSLTEKNLAFLANFADSNNFAKDEEFENLLEQYNFIKNNIEKYTPFIDLDENGVKIVNLPRNCPEIESKDFITGLFEAKKLGISVLSDQVNEKLLSYDAEELSKTFLREESHQIIHVNCEKYSISCLTEIVSNMFPCVFILPGGNELSKLLTVLELLNHLKIPKDEISVMFRLPNETDKNFNDFVKDEELNSPLSEKTKFVIISNKLPKPLIKSDIKFNLVVNLGFGNVHYTLKNFVEKHENLIFYSEETKLKDQMGWLSLE